MKESKFFSKLGKWGPIVAGVWAAAHIIVPLALLKVPYFHKYLISLDNSLPFDIPGIG